jgi:hypothetical protein
MTCYALGFSFWFDIVWYMATRSKRMQMLSEYLN